MPSTKTTAAPVAKTPSKTAAKVEVLETKIRQIQFHLVAGCFSSETNAQNLVGKLQSDGFESSVIGQNSNGLFRVAFQSFGNKEEALSQMQKLKASGKSTWLLKQ